jgi:hypothetical protein
MLDNAKATDAVSRCLIEADIAAHAAFVSEIKKAFPDPIAERRVREYLSNPVFRPLFELYHNGATSFGGALILRALDLIETEIYFVSFGSMKGHTIQAVRITREGREEFERLLPSVEAEPLFEAIETAIAGYVAIDSGAGLVARRELIDFAVQYSDMDILTRLVNLDIGWFECAHWQDEEPLSDADRLDASKYWCASVVERTGADFIDLNAVNP